MKKSIPLKEIVGFLPYGLKTTNGELIGIRNHIMWCGTFKDSTGETNIPISGIKPIVRPLSDLTKEITHNGETFVPIEEIAKIHIDWNEFDYNLKVKYTFRRQCNLEISWNHPTQKETFFDDRLFIMTEKISQNKFWVIQKLYEWHFDIYDWIKDGLAVDINDL